MIVTQIKNELSRLGIKPKKSLGQNFLINEGIYKKIIAAANIKTGDTVIEIGPGLGTLTQFILDTGADVLAVEKDYTLADYLKTKFRNNNRVTIIEGDILKFQIPDSRFQIQKYKLVGNIPYYLTSHLLRILFENWPQPELIILMIQKEVAQRIVAKPPHMSLLAVLVQYYSTPKIMSYVSRNSFWPAPEVDSAIIKLESRIQNLESRMDTKNFFKVAGAGFAKKRKQLANKLAVGLKIPKEKIEQQLSKIGMDTKRRAETLTIEEWQSITNTLLPQD